MKTGRPTLYSPELATQICEHLIAGLSIRKICALEGMPEKTTIFRWLEEKPLFRDQYARARSIQSELFVDLIHDISQECTEQNYQSSRVKINAYQWIAAKLLPKKYGDRINLDTNIQVTRIVVHDEPAQLEDSKTITLPMPVFDDEPKALPEPSSPVAPA